MQNREPEPGDDNFANPPSFFAEQVFDEPDVFETEPIEVQVLGVFETEIDRQPHQFVMLTDGVKKLPIMIGAPEAKAILDPLEQEVPDRPMTHDLIRSVIDKLGATVDRVTIDDLWHDVYYAKLILTVGREEISIDARPSDAIAVAVRFRAPIFVQSKVFELAHRE